MHFFYIYIEFTILSYFDNLTSSKLPLQIALKNTAGGEVLSEGTFSPVYDYRFMGIMGTIDTLVCLKKNIDNPLDAVGNLATPGYPQCES